MLKDAEVMAMVPVKEIKIAEKFYSQTLGLNKINESMAGITYICGSGKLFVYVTPSAGTAKSTIATWEVNDIGKIVKDLRLKGIKFMHYDYPGATHEGDVHVWEGMKAAWFLDPAGNILGLSEPAAN